MPGQLPISEGVVDWGFFENIKALPGLKVYSEPCNVKSFNRAKKLNIGITFNKKSCIFFNIGIKEIKENLVVKEHKNQKELAHQQTGEKETIPSEDLAFKEG